MPKERNYNPVQAQRKADKAKAIKKGKTEAVARRNEKLGKRNPERIQSQIDDLKRITSSGGKLTKHEETVLEGLERDLKAVHKAREALGENAPTFSRGGPQTGGYGENGVLGKRRRGGEDASSSDSDVPDDVKSIPMPRDTPPPIPKEVMDKWYAKRRERRAKSNANPNETPLGERGGRPVPRGETRKQAAPPVEVKTVYEAKPVIRDLRKEAVTAFVPTAVRMKMEKGRGRGALLEPEEADQLEREGYLKTQSRPEAAPKGMHNVTMEDAEDDEA
ncbi:WW domain binding protein 11 [Pseudomassariella vexata]|uniref:WW domain binding protein 11 n=1 Tax=Pseudomassariella vexata TaxID=1141098 RepID=A0A1Y2E782_9PEZI|nr:WW domain binding protein 11 [Pseudomassariella vexata]ORY67389.1 WW domain binding protein 11 [Pseudomassariella vexata]